MSERDQWIVWLDDQARAEAAHVGGKAWNLRRLIALGVAVPRGFAITEAAREAYATQPEAVWLAVSRACRSLAAGPAPVIVRSSAVGEDSAAASFAGCLDSIADVREAEQLRRAIVACWASRCSARVRSYERARRTRLRGMGVIVQTQIESAISGVLFTESPEGGAEAPRHRNRVAQGFSPVAECSDREMLVEYCFGPGEALVSGRVNPGRVALARSGDAWRMLAPPEEEGAHLTSDTLAELAAIGRRIEAAFGCPQDIEWTIDRRGRLWIVQARPITAAAKAAGAPDVIWSNANVNENFPSPISPLLYSVASAGYYHYFRNLGRAFGLTRRRLAAIDRPLRQIIGVHGGRMYYNLTSIHAVLRAAPFGEHLTRSFNGFVGAAEVTPAIPMRGRTRLTQLVELSWIVIRTTWQYACLTARVTRFERTIDDFAAATHPDRLTARTALELRDALRRFMDIRCRCWTDASLADAASMVCYGVLGRLLSSAFPGADRAALHNTLLKALPGLVSSQPSIELWKLSRLIRADDRLDRLFSGARPANVLRAVDTRPEFAAFKTALDEYVEHWGFRCSSELMLTTPSFQEDRTALVAILRSYAASDGESPAQVLARQETERAHETRRVLRELRATRIARWLPAPSLSPIVRVVLAWTQRAIALRERARLKQALLYSRLRRIALAIGDRLVAGDRLRLRDDIFFLTIDEIDALLSGSAMFPQHSDQLVALRRRAHADVSAMQPPDSFTIEEGTYLPLTRVDGRVGGRAEVLRQWRKDGGAEVPLHRETDGNDTDLAHMPVMQGTGACGGCVSARAAVLGDVTESDRLQSGDVLVTKQTDPGWGPVFPLIAGLVIERGGMLSHGAIIAREFGIPSVVGVRDATRLIPSGRIVSVDGDRGLVRVAPATT